MPPPSVLIVEDDESLAMLLADGLSMAGFACKTAADATQALTLAKTLKPALVVLDYMFPAGGGPVFHKGLRALESGRKTPILMLSAVDENAMAKTMDFDERTYRMGKPFEVKALVQLIREILAEA